MRQKIERGRALQNRPWRPRNTGQAHGAEGRSFGISDGMLPWLVGNERERIS
jgi:hypothetical protein